MVRCCIWMLLRSSYFALELLALRGSTEHLVDLRERGEKRVDIHSAIVDAKRCANDRRKSKAGEQRLRAEVASADSDAASVKRSADIVRMMIAERERCDGTGLARISPQARSWNLRDPLAQSSQQAVFVC